MKIGDKVQVYKLHDRYPGEVGTVQNIYSFTSTATPLLIVELESGILAKFYIDEVSKVEPEKAETPPPEGAREITKDECREALCKVVDPSNFEKFSISIISAYAVGELFRRELFKDQDSVTVNEDEFISALWDFCSPKNQSEQVNKRMSVSNCMGVSIRAFTILSEMVSILFPDVVEND